MTSSKEQFCPEKQVCTIGQIIRLTGNATETLTTQFSKCSAPENTHCEGVRDGAEFRPVLNLVFSVD